MMVNIDASPLWSASCGRQGVAVDFLTAFSRRRPIFRFIVKQLYGPADSGRALQSLTGISFCGQIFNTKSVVPAQAGTHTPAAAQFNSSA